MDCLLEFSQHSSELSQDFFPPLVLNPNSNYVLGLYSLTTYNSIPNIITNENDTISFEKVITPSAPAQASASASVKNKEEGNTIIKIPSGSYEIAQLGEFLTRKLKSKNIAFSLSINPSTMKVEMECTHRVIFPPKSIRKILGFKNDSYDPGAHTSKLIPEISAITMINVECNIVDGSFRNGVKSHCLYTFTPLVEPGFKIAERPVTMLFLPVRHREISNITLRLTDQRGKLILFNNEEITIHLVLKEL